MRQVDLVDVSGGYVLLGAMYGPHVVFPTHVGPRASPCIYRIPWIARNRPGEGRPLLLYYYGQRFMSGNRPA
jgi:hypothetical protein